MADIVVSIEPKKSAFILDYRLGTNSHSNSASNMHASSRSYAAKKDKRVKTPATKSNKKKACSGEASPGPMSLSSQSGLGKRNSFHSLSTAAPRKIIKV